MVCFKDENDVNNVDTDPVGANASKHHESTG
jgi:hypothetical protein